MIVKICGITNRADADAAVDGGATAIGFNFYARSPRYVAPETAASIVTAAGVRRVGVFVNESPARVAEIVRMARLDVAQLHGDEELSDYAGLEIAVGGAGDSPAPGQLRQRVPSLWKAVRVSAGFDLAQYDGCAAEALLLDGPAAELYGGSGKAFDWRLVGVATRRIILAGGLDDANVAQAVALARPWGVDACSKIESAPGIKDHEKMNRFLQAAKAALRS